MRKISSGRTARGRRGAPSLLGVAVWSPMLAPVTGLCGCASVRPGPDYQRAVGQIAEATGYDSVSTPADEELGHRTVEKLLNGGLTVDEAVQVALLNNPRVLAAFHRIGMARADVVQSALFSNPSLAVATRFPSGGGLVNLETSLAQNISDWWQIPRRKQVAQHALSRIVLEVAGEVSTLARETKGAYYRAVAAERLHEIRRQDRDAAARLVTVVETMRDAGAATAVEVNLSRAALHETDLAMRASRLATIETRADLIRFLGLDVDPADVALVDGLPQPPEWRPQSQELLNIAVSSRLDVRAAREQLASLEAELRLQRTRVWDLVEIGVELERGARPRSSDGTFLSKTARQTAGSQALSLPNVRQRDDESTVVVGPALSMELPVFDQNQAQIARARYARAGAEKLLAALLLDVAGEARIAAGRAETAWETARFFATDVVPLREANLDLAREAYAAGKTSLLTVLEAQRTLLDAHAAYVQALQDSAEAWVVLERVTGRPMQHIHQVNNRYEDHGTQQE